MSVVSDVVLLDNADTGDVEVEGNVELVVDDDVLVAVNESDHQCNCVANGNHDVVAVMFALKVSDT